MNMFHLLSEKHLLVRQLATVWVILTLGTISSATFATFLTVLGVDPEKSVGISLILVSATIVLIHVALYRSGYLTFEVLSTWAQFYPFENLGSQVTKSTYDIEADLFVAEIVNSQPEPELVKNTLKALFAERVNEPKKMQEGYLKDLETVRWARTTIPSKSKSESAVEYYDQVRRRYLSLLDELEKSYLKRKSKYPLALEWSQAKDIIEGQQKAEELVGFAFLESIRKLPTRQPRISLLSYVSGVDPIDVASALNIHPTEVPRWYNSGLRFLQEDQALIRKLQSISNSMP